MLTPAPEIKLEDVFERFMARVMLFATAYNIEVKSVTALASVYKDTLAVVPLDLLHQALKRMEKEWTWGNRLPMPAELLAYIPEFDARRGERLRLYTAKGLADQRDADASRLAREKAAATAKLNSELKLKTGQTLDEAKARWWKDQGRPGAGPVTRQDHIDATYGALGRPIRGAVFNPEKVLNPSLEVNPLSESEKEP